ncbi:primase-like DNA-binding domain-containing protein, partial [Bacillus toyonensis]
LNWAIEGCMNWQKDGLKEPKVVAEATEKYKDDMDILAPFLDEVCYVDERENESVMMEAKELYNVYERWCFNSGERSLGNRSFYRMLETKGFGKTKGTGNKTFLTGITLNERKPVTKGVTQISEDSKFKVIQ